MVNHDGEWVCHSTHRKNQSATPRMREVEMQNILKELFQILKECLHAMPCSYVPNHTIENLPAMIASQAAMLGEECNRADALEQQIEKLQQEIVEGKNQWRLSSVCRELTQQRDNLAEALSELLNDYKSGAESGDWGHWDFESELPIIKARKALKFQPQINKNMNDPNLKL